MNDTAQTIMEVIDPAYPRQECFIPEADLHLIPYVINADITRVPGGMVIARRDANP
jgi:hypothetical protein